MSRPRKQPIEIAPETQMEALERHFSRRRLIQLFGAAGASSVAGCGGGGQSSPTATSEGGQQSTPTERSTPTEMSTPTGDVEVTDQVMHFVTTQNFEKINPNTWNAESGYNPPFQQCPLGGSGPMHPIPTSVKQARNPRTGAIWLMGAEKLSMNTEDNVLTVDVRDDLVWGDGTPFDAENVHMHYDLLKSRVEAGEVGETRLPASVEVLDDYTIELQLVPGNPLVRLMGTWWKSQITGRGGQTHPELHGEFAESIRSATTQKETQNALRKLTNARFPADDLPKMALGPFKATEWDPSRITLESRQNFPWGLTYNDVSKVFEGVELVSITEDQNRTNAALNGKMDWVYPKTRQSLSRFSEDEWTIFQHPKNSCANLVISPKSQLGKKTEKARTMRQGLAFLMDAEEFSTINDLTPVYEQSAGYARKDAFQDWIGEDTFGEWTNYGKRDTGYLFEEKGYGKLREAGLERNKDGFWVDTEDGTPLSTSLMLTLFPRDGLTRPVVNNVVEQFNRHGIKATGDIEDQNFGDRAVSYDFDIALPTSNTEVFPHPFFGYNEDMGLGTDQIAGIWYGDWKNNIRRVTVPMPIGDQDGELQTVDWDKTTRQMAQLRSEEEMRAAAHKLSWTLNQWVPTIPMSLNRALVAIRSPGRITIADNFRVARMDDFGAGNPNLQFGAGFWQPA